MYRHEMGARFDAELDNISKARAALAAGRIVPGYQPKICLRSGAVTGFEALARLRLGDRLTEHCDMFAAAFRDPELGRAIGSCVVSQALDDMCAWRRAGVDFGRVAINSCAADFAADDFAERLLAGLAKQELEPALLELEVTENTFLGRGAQHVHRAIQLLSSRGVRIALDDFGTGFASLSHLKAFTVDVLKIDRAFITNVERDPDNAAIVRAVVGLARSLGLETVAEGVETLGQAACVTHMGCCTGQGYLYGTAGPASAVPRLLARAPAGRAA
jgi:EAL domain-containing protein (putative c-di-GMP-specific phosphodiesterase class I)